MKRFRKMGTLIPKITLFLLLLGVEWATAEDAPKDCSMRRVCSELRQRVPEEDELYRITSFENNEGTFYFSVTNNMGNELILLLASVESNMFRVGILETDFHRYQIPYILQKDPVYRNLDVTLSNETYLSASDIDENSIEVFYDPLKILFYHKGVIESVLDGSRLIMDNTDESQAFTFLWQFIGSDRLTGLFEHSTPLNLVHTADFSVDPYRLKNVDHPYYPVNKTMGLYGSVPLIYAVGDTTSGLFIHNAAEMWIEIDNTQQSAYFMVNGGMLDLFVLTGPTLKDAVRQYTSLTGTAHLPQLWALGYQQSRFAYQTTEQVKDIVQNFDLYNFPLDVVWLDVNYTDNYKYFTWDYSEFPDPIAMLDWVDSQANRKIVILSDCHIKIDTEYPIYNKCLESGYFINSSTGGAYENTCWPGPVSWIDFLNPEATDYYASLHSYDNFPSTSTLAGFWNDMNEPATFDTENERGVSDDIVHYGGVVHRDMHNMYGFLNVRSTHKGLIERDNNTLRPFILSRSCFAGSQRYTAKWSGDMGGSFDYLRATVPMSLSANLAGIVFYGSDIPGFFDNPTEELAARWYQMGSWIPFYRAHGDQGTQHREPWVFSIETQGYIRDAIEIRYKHIPTWYTLFYEHTITGDPMIRPLFYHYPQDKNTLDLYDEYLVGSNILVANVYYSEASSLAVYFPDGSDYWFQITGDSNNVFQGGQWVHIPVDITFIPIFYKYGSIITRKPNAGRSTADTKDDPYEVHAVVNLEDGLAKGFVYIDDFKSFEYLNSNSFVYFELTYNHTDKSLSIRFEGGEDNANEFPFYVGSVIVYLRNDDGAYTVETLTSTKDGTPLQDTNLLESSVQL